MEGWALPFIAGWYCGSTGSRIPEWLWRLLRKIPPPPPPDDGWPIKHPWGAVSPIVYGAFGGAGGVGAWALTASSFTHDPGMWPGVVIGILGGGVGLTVADTLSGMTSGDAR